MAIIRIINVHGTFDAEPTRTGDPSYLKWWQGERQFTGQPVEMPDRMEVAPSEFVEEIARKFGADEGRAVAECFRWSGSYKETMRREAGMRLANALESAINVEDDTYFVLVGHSHGGTVIRYALQYIDLPRHKLDRILSWNTIGTPFLHFRRPINFWNLSLAKMVAILAAVSFMIYVLGAFFDVRCRLQAVDDEMWQLPDRLCRVAEGYAPLATASEHGVEVSAEDVLNTAPTNMQEELPIEDGETVAEALDQDLTPEAEAAPRSEQYLGEDATGDLFQYGENYAENDVSLTGSADELRVEAKKEAIRTAFGEFRRGLILMGLVVVAFIGVMVFSGRKINKAHYNVLRTRRFKHVFLPKWNGFLNERDEAVVGLGLGAEKFSDQTQIIPPGALRPILFVIVLMIIFWLILGWEIALNEDGQSGNPLISMIQNLQELLRIKEKDEGFFSQWLTGAFNMNRDVAALFDVPIEFGIGAFILVAISSLFVSFPWTNYVRSMGDARIVRSIRAILLGTDDIQGESVFAVRYFPKGGDPTRATILPEEVAVVQTKRVNDSAPQTLEFIRKEIGLYGLNLGGEVPNLSDKVGQHFTWDELYHTTYFRVPEVRYYLVEEIAARTPQARSF